MKWNRRSFSKTSAGALAGLSLSSCRGESGGETIVFVVYACGLLELKDGTTRRNHRVALGMQIF